MAVVLLECLGVCSADVAEDVRAALSSGLAAALLATPAIPALSTLSKKQLKKKLHALMVDSSDNKCKCVENGRRCKTTFLATTTKYNVRRHWLANHPTSAAAIGVKADPEVELFL